MQRRRKEGFGPLHLVSADQLRSWDPCPPKNLHQVGGLVVSPHTRGRRLAISGDASLRSWSRTSWTSLSLFRERGGSPGPSSASESFNGDGRGGLYFSARGEIL